MKNYIYLLLLFFSSSIYGQTDSLVNVTGTKCSMVPPKGFTTAVGFNGFQQPETGASILLMEFPAAYTQIISGFTADALKSQGMDVVQKQTIVHAGKDATMMLVNQRVNNTDYIKHVLLFGDSTFTVMVNGIYPAAANDMESEIKKAMYSVIYNASNAVSGEEIANFTVDISNTGFSFAAYLSGSLIYTPDGKMPTESVNKEMIIVGTSFQNINIENRKEYCIARLKSLPYGEKNEATEINPITINDLQGYEIVADGFDKQNNKQLIYQVILFTDSDSYYIFLATTDGEFDKNLPLFKSVAKTFARR